eukprot:466270-Pelagomonas_calceolata.AAC.1
MAITDSLFEKFGANPVSEQCALQRQTRHIIPGGIACRILKCVLSVKKGKWEHACNRFSIELRWPWDLRWIIARDWIIVDLQVERSSV